ncbi:MAG: hypothetical protein Q8O37_06785 [Sulfuricellaceae bacterium]|nr:hypothetical protein [Sulfuricellaceae bacterium]
MESNLPSIMHEQPDFVHSFNEINVEPDLKRVAHGLTLFFDALFGVGSPRS